VSVEESEQPFRIVVLGERTGGRLVPGELPAADRRFNKVLRYLRSGTWVIRDEGTACADPVDPSAAPVPRGYRTDGDWIWPLAAEHLLERHGVAPPPEFMELMAERGFYSPRVYADRCGQARQALLPRIPGPYEPPAPIQFRLPPDVYDLFVTVGWAPGRDVGAEVDAWWPGADPAGRGEPALPDDLLAAGRAVLAEFGGLTFPVYGYGRDWRVMGFQLFPKGRPSDPSLVAAATGRVGGPLMSLGTVPEWKSEIVLHPRHGIGTAGDVELFLGRDGDEALTSLIRGAAPPAQHRAATGWLR